MIQSFLVINRYSDELLIPLSDPSESGLIVQSVDGLGPVTAAINTTEIVTTDGSRFNSARLSQRNIVFHFIFFDDQTDAIAEIRRKTYLFFSPKQKVELRIATENRMYSIEGYVESNEPTIFSEQEGCQVSIICPDPYFYSLDNDEGITRIEFNSHEPLLEFPISNEVGNDTYSNLGSAAMTRYTEGTKIKIRSKGNFLPVPLYSSATAYGITFDAQSDGSVHIYGTPTEIRSIARFSTTFSMPAGSYKLAGGPVNSSTTRMRMYLQTHDGTSWSTVASYYTGISTANRSFTLAETTSCRLQTQAISSSYTGDLEYMDEVFYPRVLYSSDTEEEPATTDYATSVIQSGEDTTSGTEYQLTEGVLELEALDGINNFELSPSGTVFGAIYAEVGRIDNTSQRNIYYDGDSEVGVVITLHANEVTVNPKIHNLTANTSIQIDSTKISGGIKAGDEIVISTVKGRKSATLLRNGATYNILSALGRDVQWFTLQHGDNGFSLSADQGLSTLEMVMSFRTRFEGV